MMTVVRVLVILMLLPLAGRCRSRSAAHDSAADKPIAKSSVPVRTTICAIAENPHKFYGTRVTVDGCVTTDGIEHTVLGDKTCPYVAIGPVESVKLQPTDRFFPEVDKEVCGTFSGIYQATRSLDNKVVDTNVLEIEETANLRVVSRSIAPANRSTP